MSFKILLVFFLMALVAVFSVQNAGPITVHFLHWHFTLSQALVILLSAFCGALVGLVAGALGCRGRPALPPGPAAPAPTDTP